MTDRDDSVAPRDSVAPHDSVAAGCPSEELLLSYVRGALCLQERERVVVHTSGCEACRRTVAGLLHSSSRSSSTGEKRRPPMRRPSVRTLEAGERIADRYVIVRLIAQGGMGVVYEADDSLLGEPVALKTIANLETIGVRRFKREAQLARQVTHPSVCRVFDVGQHQYPSGDSFYFISMELLSGETLRHWLVQPTRPTESAVIGLALQMAQGLAAAHQAGVVHRDFKCSNVLLDEERAVIADFGLARHHAEPNELTVSGTVLGTPGYLAPEQLAGEAVTAATDVYAFGVVFFRMLTGLFPSEAVGSLLTISDQLAKHSEWTPLLSRCLARAPNDRFKDAGELVKAMQTIAASSGSRRVFPRRQALSRSMRSMPVVLAGAAAVALTLAVWSHRQSLATEITRFTPVVAGTMPVTPLPTLRLLPPMSSVKLPAMVPMVPATMSVAKRWHRRENANAAVAPQPKRPLSLPPSKPTLSRSRHPSDNGTVDPFPPRE